MVQQWPTLVKNELSKRLSNLSSDVSSQLGSGSSISRGVSSQSLAASVAATDPMDVESPLWPMESLPDDIFMDGDHEGPESQGLQGSAGGSGRGMGSDGTVKNVIPIVWSSRLRTSETGEALAGNTTTAEESTLDVRAQPWFDQVFQRSLNKTTLQRVKTLAQGSVVDMKHALSDMNHSELAQAWFLQLMCIRKQEDALTSIRKSTKLKNQQIRRLQQQLVKRKNELKEIVQQGQNTLDIVRTGWRLSWKTSIALGLRKLMCIISANSFPLASLIDVSRWTIIRCEVLAWALILGRTRAWYRIVLQLVQYVCDYYANHQPSLSLNIVSASEVRDVDDDTGVSKIPPTQDDAIRNDFGLPSGPALVSSLNVTLAHKELDWQGLVGSTFWSGDATNSSIWKRQKLQGIEIKSTLLVDRRALCSESYDKAFRIMNCMFLGSFIFETCCSVVSSCCRCDIMHVVMCCDFQKPTVNGYFCAVMMVVH